MKEESRRQGLDIKKIFSESPSEEQWKRLLTYTYPNNIERYFRKNGYDQFSSELIETIAGSISQAKEYFDASKVTSLNISPLLLYYGTSNLYYGISGLLNCELFDIKNHGMTIKKPETSLRIGDIQIKPTNKKEGALSKFSEIFDCNLDICNTGTWDVIELFASIPEVLEDFLGCYEKEPNVIPVSVIKDRKGTVERINPQYIQ